MNTRGAEVAAGFRPQPPVYSLGAKCSATKLWDNMKALPLPLYPLLQGKGRVDQLPTGRQRDLSKNSGGEVPLHIRGIPFILMPSMHLFARPAS